MTSLRKWVVANFIELVGLFLVIGGIYMACVNVPYRLQAVENQVKSNTEEIANIKSLIVTNQVEHTLMIYKLDTLLKIHNKQ